MLDELKATASAYAVGDRFLSRMVALLGQLRRLAGKAGAV